MFLYYYLITGTIMATTAFIFYDDCEKKFPIISVVGKPLFTLGNFAIGFLNFFPILFLVLSILRYKILIYIGKKRNEKLRQQIENQKSSTKN